MTRSYLVLILIALTLSVSLGGCTGDSSESGEGDSNSESGEHSNESESGEHGEGSEEGSERSGSGDEESATQYKINETYDQVRRGARLVISFDSASNAFIGTVENTTETTLPRVRVEVHLSNGVELGPTTPIDLPPGQTAPINLPASSQPFETWSAHPEVG